MLAGYRANFSYAGAWRSILMVHNETANIWTHLAGLFLFLAITASMVGAGLFKYLASYDVASAICQPCCP